MGGGEESRKKRQERRHGYSCYRKGREGVLEEGMKEEARSMRLEGGGPRGWEGVGQGTNMT